MSAQKATMDKKQHYADKLNTFVQKQTIWTLHGMTKQRTIIQAVK